MIDNAPISAQIAGGEAPRRRHRRTRRLLVAATAVALLAASVPVAYGLITADTATVTSGPMTVGTVALTPQEAGGDFCTVVSSRAGAPSPAPSLTVPGGPGTDTNFQFSWQPIRGATGSYQIGLHVANNGLGFLGLMAATDWNGRQAGYIPNNATGLPLGAPSDWTGTYATSAGATSLLMGLTIGSGNVGTRTIDGTMTVFGIPTASGWSTAPVTFNWSVAINYDPNTCIILFVSGCSAANTVYTCSRQ